VCTIEHWASLIEVTRRVHVAPVVAEYAVSIGRATRQAPSVRLGASPRASISLVRSAQAHALLYGRDFVSPVDLQAMAIPSLAHRVVTDGTVPGSSVVAEILRSLPAPRP